MPNVDFLHLYGPASLHVLAVWYRVFGDTLESQRTFGLLQHLGIIFAVYALARAWGHRLAAIGAALGGTLLILTPIGLSALAWDGARRRSALWTRRVRASGRCTPSDRDRELVAAPAALAGLALGFRPDLVVALGLALGFAIVAAPGDVPVPAGWAPWSGCSRCGSTWSSPAPARRRGAWCIDPVRPTCGRAASCRGRRAGASIDGALQAVAEGRRRAVVAASRRRRPTTSCSSGSSS